MKLVRIVLLLCSSWGLLLLGGLAGCKGEIGRARELVQKKAYTQAAEIYEKIIKDDRENYQAHLEAAQLYCDRDKLWKEALCLRHTGVLLGKATLPKQRVRKKLSKKERKLKREKEKKLKEWRQENLSPQKEKKLKEWRRYAMYRRIINYFQEMRVKGARKYIDQYEKLGGSPAMVAWMRATVKLRSNLGLRGAPQDQEELREAIKDFRRLLKLPDAEKRFAIFDSQKLPLKWYAYMGIGQVYDIWLMEKLNLFQKKQRELLQKRSQRRRKRRRRRRRRRRKRRLPRFVPNAKHFRQALSAYQKARKAAPSHFKAYLQIGALYFRYKQDLKKALYWAEKAKAQAPKNNSVLCTVGRFHVALARKSKGATRLQHLKEAKKYLPKCPRKKR